MRLHHVMSTSTNLLYKSGLILCTTVLAFAFTSNCALAASGKRSITGKIYIADTEPGATAIDEKNHTRQVLKKDVYRGEGTALETNEKSHTAAVFSNNSAIVLDTNTYLKIPKYRQEPIPPGQSSLDAEPSVSQTSLFIERGSVAMCSGKTAAGSSTTIGTDLCTLSSQGPGAVVEVTATTTTVSLVAGDITVRTDAKSGGAALKPGEQAIVTKDPNGGPPSIKIQPIPQNAVARVNAKVAAACDARKSVSFRMREGDRQLTPVTTGINVTDSNPGTGTDDDNPEIIVDPVLPGSIPPKITISPYKK